MFVLLTERTPKNISKKTADKVGGDDDTMQCTVLKWRMTTRRIRTTIFSSSLNSNFIWFELISVFSSYLPVSCVCLLSLLFANV